MMKLRLVGNAQTRAFRCIWMLEELQIPYELSQAMPGSKEILAYYSSGKVPALIVNDENGDNKRVEYVVTDSAVINTFLGDRFPESALVPKFATPQRIVYDQLVMNIMTELDASALWVHRKHTMLGKFFGYIPQIEKASLQQFTKANDYLAMQLKKSGGPYLLGKQFTAADILYGHCLNWAKSNGWGDAMESDTVAAYMRTYRERPAYQRTREISKTASATTGKVEGNSNAELGQSKI